ncbi:MAG TPA: ATP-binding protein [Caulobacteraceae bacterium]|jgi:signal transduction histidine kinase
MRRRSPSLALRVALAFLIAFGAILVAITLGVAAISQALDEATLAGDSAFALTLRDVETDAAGRPVLRTNGELPALVRASPGYWAFVRSDAGEASYGPVPADAMRAIRSPPMTEWDEFSLTIPVGGLGGRVTATTIEGVQGRGDPMILGVGGVTPGTATFEGAIAYMAHADFHWAVLGLVVLGILAVLAVIPVVRLSVRPLARAAAGLDPADLGGRLPEESAPRELLPVVRAFNAALARLEETFERRRRFMADVAHEFRTPLAVLNMHVETLPESASRTDLQRGVFRLSEMIGQMLDSERLRGPRRPDQEVDLAALAKAAVADVAPIALSAGYDLTYSGEQAAPVRGDPHAIKRAVANLLGNAVAHGGGGGEIAVRVTADRIVEVADEGPGVGAEARERVFDPFYRERWDKDGCGLGLHLVSEIMHAHGGRAELADSTRGARFRLLFPAPAA